MRPETAAALYDMSQAADRIVEATEGKAFDDYQSDWYFQSAVERQFEIIGEALNRAAQVDDTVEQLVPELRRIVGLRNRVIHGYDSVDDELLWSVMESNIPSLKATLAALLT